MIQFSLTQILNWLIVAIFLYDLVKIIYCKVFKEVEPTNYQLLWIMIYALAIYTQ